MKKSNSGLKEPRAGQITTEILKQHAEPLARVLFRLHKDDPELTSDKLWGLIKKFWSESELLEALKADPKKFRGLLNRDPEKLPQAAKNGFFKIDGELWGALNPLAKKLKVSVPYIREKLEVCRSREGRDCRGKTRRYFALKDVKKICSSLLRSGPRASTGGFFVADGEEWGSLTALTLRLSLSRLAINARLESCRSRCGRNLMGRSAVFYAFLDVKRACEDLLEVLPRSGKDGLFLYKGEKWGNVDGLVRLLQLSKAAIVPRLRGCAQQKGKDTVGRVLVFYRLADVRKACSDLLSPVSVANEHGFIKVKGERWGSSYTFTRSFGVTAHVLKKRLAGLEKVQGKGRGGEITLFYRLKDVRRVCADLLNKNVLRAGRDRMLLIDGQKWATVRTYADISGISTLGISVRLRSLRSVQGRDKSGKLAIFYLLSDIEKVCADLASRSQRRRSPITPGDLRIHANKLACILLALHKKLPTVTSDGFFQALMKHWSKPELTKAIETFEKRKKLDPFLALMQSTV